MNYRLPTLEDKEMLLSYIEEHFSNHEKSLSASHDLTSMKYEDWVEKINRNVDEPDATWGKYLTYLSFNDNGKLVGLLSVRFGMPENLVGKYGHIGYGVRPTERRKGYATEMLAFALEECKKRGMDKVILGCYKENVASAKTILKNKGKLLREEDEYSDINGCWKINLVNQFYEIEL